MHGLLLFISRLCIKLQSHHFFLKFVYSLNYLLWNSRFLIVSCRFFFFYLGFLSRIFTIHRTAGEGGGYLFNSSLPLPPASQTHKHSPGDYCREFTSNRQPLVSERKSLTTKLLMQIRSFAIIFNINTLTKPFYYQFISSNLLSCIIRPFSYNLVWCILSISLFRKFSVSIFNPVLPFLFHDVFKWFDYVNI